MNQIESLLWGHLRGHLFKRFFIFLLFFNTLFLGFIPIIAPPQSKRYRKRFFKSLSGFTPGLLSPETD
ncbi:TPA: hypothetical protein ACT92P_005228, partial [Klebsiella pneumoniae]